MDNSLYRFLMATAVSLTVLWLGWAMYDSLFRHAEPGEYSYHAGNQLFEDGHYDRALANYEEALVANPGSVHALRGMARCLLQLQRYPEALAAFNLALEQDPNAAATYANRGILYDRMGEYDRALKDYEVALRLDPDLAKGPNWLTRFLRNQAEKPPTILERASYLKQQFALPPERRLLQQPELDAQQRPYKM